MSKKLKYAIISVLFTIFAFWAGGFDFNERGIIAVAFIISVLVVFALTYTCPYIEEDKQ